MQSNGQAGAGAFDAVADQVFSIIASVKQIPRESISLDSAFHELGLDSLDTIILVSEMEDHFEVAISNDEARAIVRVRDAIERILALRLSPSSGAAPQAG
jgi:acyl carrier protein